MQHRISGLFDCSDLRNILATSTLLLLRAAAASKYIILLPHQQILKLHHSGLMYSFLNIG
jgi:hypothetical protein